MVAKKPRIVIIGAGMAGLVAANKLYTCARSQELFELCVVEGGTRIGGRISTTEFGGDQIEMGATWIHGVGGSPIHKIAQEIKSLESEQPWECKDGFLDDDAVTITEGGYELNPSFVEPVSSLFKKLMDFAQVKEEFDDGLAENFKLAVQCISNGNGNGGSEGLSLGSFLRKGFEAYWNSVQGVQENAQRYGNWNRKSLEEGIFAMHENVQRTFTSAGDLLTLDYNAESEYRMFPGEEITIAKGYLSVIEALASVLPAGLIQLGRRVSKIEWRPEALPMENGHATTATASSRPVKLHFCDGSTMSADHVLVTVSLGVLKAGIREDSGMFSPPLPWFKTQSISRLGYGVVNKLFLQLSPPTNGQDQSKDKYLSFPFLQMVFHQSDPELMDPKIPWWMRRTASLCPIYRKSNVVLSWFAGKEALELESLNDEEILDGVSTTISCFLSNSRCQETSSSHKPCNGNANENGKSVQSLSGDGIKFIKVLKSTWGTDPLFLGSYSYVAVGSNGDDMDTLAEPLPKNIHYESKASSPPPPLQILFAGEATHRIHYSTTHGAYFSGLREANRLLQHFQCIGV